jgi:hypothetical protein
MDLLRRPPSRKHGSRQGHTVVALVERLERRSLLATLTPIPAAVNFTAGVQPASAVTVGSFTDSDTTAVQGDFTATIDWGDTQSSAGTVVASTTTPGLFSVTGTHLYAAPNTYSVTIAVSDYSNDSTTIDSKAYVSGSVVTPVPVTITPTAGQPLTNVTVASFLDTNPADNASNLSATITWGDGNVTPGKVIQGSSSGLFNVQGSNTYVKPGTYAISVEVDGLGGKIATVSSTAIVSAPVIATGTTLSATLGAPLVGVSVATFTDSNPNAAASTATINWGDGTATSAGTVTPGSNGTFTVDGTHTYTTPSPSGAYPITVTIIDPSGQTATTTSTAVILFPLTPMPLTITPTAGQPLNNVIVASFLDTNPADNASNLSATITWGNGNVTPGKIIQVANSDVFDVEGSNTYGTPGTYAISVVVTELSGKMTTVSSTAIVSAPVIATGTTFTVTPGVLLADVTVATFTDSNPNAAASTATINWGDGTATSTGTVTPVPGSNGTFTVTGTHTYAISSQPGSYAITVTIMDPSGQTASTNSTALILISTSSPSLVGGLTNVISNGPHAAMGFTNTDRPTFSGTTAPFSTVQLYGRHFNADAELPLGEAVASTSGQWTLTTGPLAVGTWVFAATVTVPGGYPSNMIPLTNPSGGDLVYINLSPRLVRWLSHGQKSVPHPRMPKPPGARHHKA